MKLRFVTLLNLAVLFFSATGTLYSQIPQGINYQAIARDAGGAVLDNKSINIELTIQTSTGIPVWREVKSLTSNQFGLITTVLGTGPNQIGTPATFSGIDWNATLLYLRTRVEYPVGQWNEMGTSQIMSVPYALMAKDVEGPVSKLGIVGTTTLPEEALFEVKNKNGELVFAVYNEGVRVYVPDGAKGAKGGFAVSGFSYNKTLPENYLYVGPDSIRAYIWDDPLIKGAKGGFTVSGFNSAKKITNNYLTVTPDSVAVLVDDVPAGKGAKGGFTVSGFNTSKGVLQNLLKVSDEEVRIAIDDSGAKGAKGGFAVTGFAHAKGSENDYLLIGTDSARIYVNQPDPGAKGGFQIKERGTLPGELSSFTYLEPDNYFIGHRSGYRNWTGVYNSFLGFEAGMNNTIGNSNAFFGYKSGHNNDNGNGNLFLGYESGFTNESGNYNTFVGYKAGNMNSFGQFNTFLGSYAGQNNSGGGANTFVGYESGISNSSGYENIFIGTGSGRNNSSGSSNIFIGSESGAFNNDGKWNVYIGTEAGKNSTNGNWNIFVGYQSGLSNSTGNNNSFIGYQTGMNNTVGGSNLFIGYSAGSANLSGNANVFLGSSAGLNNFSGNSNIFIGTESGKSNTTGFANTYIGRASGNGMLTGNDNIFLGYAAGSTITSGTKNTYLGAYSGDKTGGLSGNVFIGHSAGNSEHSSNRLIIANSDTKNLIYGDFTNDWVIVNSKLAVNTTHFSVGSHNFFVNGTSKIGTNGTTINDIIRRTATHLGLGDMSAGVAVKVDLVVDGAQPGGTVSASPMNELPDGLVISYARVKSANTVEIKFQNAKGSTLLNVPGNTYYITVIQ